jgi:hypothetical protein
MSGKRCENSTFDFFDQTDYFGLFLGGRNNRRTLPLQEFLVHAKKAGYATAGEGGERTVVDGGKELTFARVPFRYRDRYFGFNPFIGQEVVWQDDTLVWAMNYYGYVHTLVVPVANVYAFLQQALRQVDVHLPLRGPRAWQSGNFTYWHQSTGDLDHFVGSEHIAFKGEEIYTLHYHGGNVQAQELRCAPLLCLKPSIRR